MFAQLAGRVLSYLLQNRRPQTKFCLTVWSLMLPLFVPFYQGGSLITQNVVLDIGNVISLGAGRTNNSTDNNILDVQQSRCSGSIRVSLYHLKHTGDCVHSNSSMFLLCLSQSFHVLIHGCTLFFLTVLCRRFKDFQHMFIAHSREQRAILQGKASLQRRFFSFSLLSSLTSPLMR